MPLQLLFQGLSQQAALLSSALSYTVVTYILPAIQNSLLERLCVVLEHLNLSLSCQPASGNLNFLSGNEKWKKKFQDTWDKRIEQAVLPPHDFYRATMFTWIAVLPAGGFVVYLEMDGG